jgi:8-oxo-dGTP pyrophosphatase MutT (NUDIX family)
VNAAGFRRLGERLVYQGHLWRVVVASFEAPDGRRFDRDVVRSPGAVGIVPVRFDSEGTPSVVLVRQYRAALGSEVTEIPAGMRDVDGESPERTAHRELAEEVGLAAGRLDLLAVFHNAVGMTDAVTHVYLATGLTPVPPQAQGPEEDAMVVLQIPLAEAVAEVVRGSITDAKTVIGLLLTERRLAAGG